MREQERELELFGFPAPQPSASPHHSPPFVATNMRGLATTLLSAVIAAQTVLASPIRARSPYLVKETHNAPHGWTKQDRANGDRIIQLQIGLKQGNWDELEKQLYEGKPH